MFSKELVALCVASLDDAAASGNYEAAREIAQRLTQCAAAARSRATAIAARLDGRIQLACDHEERAERIFREAE